MAYIGTVAGVKDQLPGYQGGSTEDTLLGDLVHAAHDAAVAYCGRDFLSTAYTATMNGNDQRRIILPQSPITAVTSLTIYGTSIPAAASSTGYGYMFDDTGLYLINGNTGTAGTVTGYYRFPRGVRNIYCAYTAGYATVPQDLIWACNRQAAAWYIDRKRMGQSSVTLQGQTSAFLTGQFLPEVEATFKRYQRMAMFR